MLSIGVMELGQGGYYLNLVEQGDYYTLGGEPAGIWLGHGAKSLGLSGTVHAQELEGILAGFSPDGQPLVQNAGEETRRPGFDLTFSAPKTVSTLFALADAQTRIEIQQAQLCAVKAGLNYLEDTAGVSRRGKGGHESIEASLVAAAFEHGTSRRDQPQLHTHLLIGNVAVCADGVTRSVDGSEIFAAKMAGGAVYRLELTNQLEHRLGVKCRREKTWFEIEGVPKELADHFSERRAEMMGVIGDGPVSPEVAAKAALETREPKQHRPRAELIAEWQVDGRAFGFGPQEAKELLWQQTPREDSAARTHEAIQDGIQTITQNQSHFTERDLVRRAAEAGQGQGVGAEVLRHCVQETLRSSPEILPLAQRGGPMRYTTREIMSVEAEMLAKVSHLMSRQSFQVEAGVLETAIQQRPTMRGEQAEALRSLAESPAVGVVLGRAGTGKTYLLEAAREVWEKSGFDVRGAAFTGKAHGGLEDESSIPSTTLHRLLYQIEDGRFRVTDRTVIVLDEAGMVGTKQMAKLVDEVVAGGGKLVLVGDPQQLQPIEQGGPLTRIARTAGCAELKEIIRQREPWAREAIHSVLQGEAHEALKAYAEQGLLFVENGRDEAIRAMVSDWAETSIQEPEKHLMLAPTRREAFIVNRLVQERRKSEGLLSDESVHLANVAIHEADRVMFTRNSDMFGVKNGEMGTVVHVDQEANSLIVAGDSGKYVTLDVDAYPHVTLAYCTTTHKAQGTTVDRASVLVGGAPQDRELSYVQTSRARDETRIYVDVLEAGEELSQLARQMSRSHQKDLAHDVLLKQQELILDQGQRK